MYNLTEFNTHRYSLDKICNNNNNNNLYKDFNIVLYTTKKLLKYAAR